MPRAGLGDDEVDSDSYRMREVPIEFVCFVHVSHMVSLGLQS